MSLELDPVKSYRFDSHSLPEFVDQMDVCRGELLLAAERFINTAQAGDFELMGTAAKCLNTEFCQAVQTILYNQDMRFFDKIRAVDTLKQHELVEIAMGLNWILDEEALELPESMDLDKFTDSLIEKGLRGDLSPGIDYKGWYEAEIKAFGSGLATSLHEFSKRCLTEERRVR